MPLDGGVVPSPNDGGLGIDLVDPHTFEHLPPTAIERAARRWLSPEERAWCAEQPCFRLAMVTVLSCKESVCKATGGRTSVAEATIIMQGAWPKGRARAAGHDTVALWWEAGSGHILTIGLRRVVEARGLLEHIMRGRGATEAA
jgi:4'-phosphopantetheinyl transferase superfamily protein